MNSNIDEKYLTPDYSEDSPSEDDTSEIEELLDKEDLEDQRMENLLDSQKYESDLTNINNKMDTSFNSPPRFNGSIHSNTTTQQTSTTPNNIAPWDKDRLEREKQAKATSSQVGGTNWVGGSIPTSPIRPSFMDREREDKEKKEEEARKAAEPPLPIGHREVVVCNLLDGLYEPYKAENRPGMRPGGIYDLKPKFNVWDKIKFFSPSIICVLVPHYLRNSVLVNYVRCCLSDYFMIPPDHIILSSYNVRSAKIAATTNFAKMAKDKKDILYVGTYCGEWGLSSEDADVSKLVGIDCVSIYKLLGY